MSGLQQTAPIVVPVKSGRTKDIDVKRRRTAYRAGLVVCLSVSSDDFDRQCVADSDSRLFKPDIIFLGVTALTPDIGLPVTSVAVGGVINILNTGRWPVLVSDIVYALIRKVPIQDPLTDFWYDVNHNKYIDFEEPWPIVCSEIYATDNTIFEHSRYHLRRIGTAISSEFSNVSDRCTHQFSVMLDEPQARED